MSRSSGISPCLGRREDLTCVSSIHQMDREGQPIELFGDGSQSRDFTYVDDIAKGTIAAIKPVGFEIFNLGGGNNPISLNQIILGLRRI